MEQTPQKIFENFLNKTIDKATLVENLTSIIENSDNLNVRKDCLEILKNINLKDENTFKFLENLLISDKFEVIRRIAAELIKQKFIEKAIEPMKWALFHEESPENLQIIYDILIEIVRNLGKEDDSTAKSILYNEITKIDQKEFNLGLENNREFEVFEKFKEANLIDILVNYYTLIFLKKNFWRVKYKIDNCTVTELDFIFKGLTSIPNAIKNLSSIKALIFRYNQILNLPDWIGSLSSLESLNLNVNNINKLPDSIGSLSSLKELLLWKNDLKNLPDSIGSLRSLESLNLRLNQLEDLPETIANLNSLKELNLHDNKLIEIPQSIGLLRSLEKLNLSWNELRIIPNSIGKLSSLKILDLGRNELEIIPNSIGSLSSLEDLNLSENNLKTIPDSIGNLKSLQKLDLSRNELINLPENIENLRALKELYIGDNRLNNQYPKAFRNLEANGVKIYY